MTYVDTPNKKQKHPHYEHRTAKLNIKDNEFKSKEFHKIRKSSKHHKLIKSFGRIGMCLNGKSAVSLPVGDLDKVCFILMNDYDDEGGDLGVGPLNDGYLIGLNHHRFGFKVFYLYNCQSAEFTSFLAFFLKNTSESLTVFYSGRSDNDESIKFNNGYLPKSYITEVISKNCIGNNHVMFITDCVDGGSVFDIHGCQKAVSFSVNKTESSGSKRNKRSHGIFTYYFCKITNDAPNITPNRLIERMNPSINRFDEKFCCEMSNEEIGTIPLFK